MEKYNKEKISKLLLFKELLERQKGFIEKNKLDKFSIEEDFNNFISNDNSLPLDSHGFIDYKKLEDDGEV